MMITFRKFIKDLIVEADAPAAAPPAGGAPPAGAAPPPAGGPSPLGDVGGGLGGGGASPMPGGAGGLGGGLGGMGGPSPSLGGDLGAGAPGAQAPQQSTELYNDDVWFNVHNYFKPPKKAKPN